jgi:hypothetical protein
VYLTFHCRYPDGNKYFNVKFLGIKCFLHPYFYLMMDHFFRENQPLYDMKSKDQPNEYSEDYETYPEIHAQFQLLNSIICLASCDTPESSSTLGIGCQATVDFEFKREKIKKVKETLWDRIQSEIASFKGGADEERFP